MKKIKLFCLPHAGSSSTLYCKWNAYAKGFIKIIPVELAGRGMRSDEALYDTFENAVSDIFEKLVENIENENYALFGHSMGGILVYDLCLKIAEIGITKPINVFISGCLPPHIETDEKDLHDLPMGEFKTEVMELGGTENDVFETAELWEYYEPVLRSDLRIIETRFESYKKEKIDVNLTVLYGKDDDMLSNKTKDVFYNIDEWGDYTTKTYGSHVFNGDHFYLYDYEQKIMDIIINQLKKDI